MKYWLFPGNKNLFRIEDFVDEHGFIEWDPRKYKNKIQVGDIVYIYIGNPEKRICYKAVVETINIPFNKWFNDRPYQIPPSNIWLDEHRIRLRIICSINSEYLHFQRLKENGITTVNWISELKNDSLIRYIEKYIG